jgi:adrenodoxin-NADP+ reductase
MLTFSFNSESGHPDYAHIGDQVRDSLGQDTTDGGVLKASVVVIGQGNVALDCARILAKGRSGLFQTDIVSHALDVIKNGVTNVHIIGRRGHLQGAFTIKELRELTKLESDGFDAFLSVRSDELDLGATEASKFELDAANGRPRKRIDQLLRESADASK